MSGAGAVIEAAAAAALRQIEGLAVHDASPVQAAAPYAVVAAAGEADWGHKSGAGREVRLAVTLFDRGERPQRLHGLAAEAEAMLEGLARELGGWRLVSLQMVRSRMAPPQRGSANGLWACAIDYRARLLAGG